MGIASVEKALGLKSRGDAARMKPLVGKDGGACELLCSSSPSATRCEAESGDNEGPLPMEFSLDEAGDALSGLAIRSPPRDWARLKSPSMAAYGFVSKGLTEEKCDTARQCPGCKKITCTAEQACTNSNYVQLLSVAGLLFAGLVLPHQSHLIRTSRFAVIRRPQTVPYI